MAVRVLIAPGAGAGIDDKVSDERLAELYAAPATPWLRVNMVSTLDGAAAGESGRTGSINNVADKRVFHLLRRLAEVVVVGAGTVRAEGYRPADVPLVVVTRSGEVPETLRDAPAGKVLVATCAAAPHLAEARARVGADGVLVCGTDHVDLGLLRRSLVERGHLSLLCEGGPQLLRDLLAQGVVDELAATFVPRLVGGGHPRITDGAALDVPLELRLLLEDQGTLLGRWFTPST